MEMAVSPFRVWSYAPIGATSSTICNYCTIWPSSMPVLWPKWARYRPEGFRSFPSAGPTFQVPFRQCHLRRVPIIRRTRRWISSAWPWRPAWHWRRARRHRTHPPRPRGGEDKPLRKLNPNPKRAYVITMKVEGAPGPFAVVRGVAQYDVENAPECGRYLKFAGVYPDMTSMESFPLTRVSDTEYEGRVYFDLLLDEDYFGRGVCRWKFMQAQVALKATGGKQETEFLPYLRAKAIHAEESQTRYFWKGRYPRSQTENFPSFGQEDRATFAQGISDDDLFIIKLTSREIRP